MTNKRATLEVIAPTVEEAIQDGLEDLGLPREKVTVEVLDEGSSGLLGLGSRQSRVRISIKSGEDAEQETPSEIAGEVEPTPEAEAEAEDAYHLNLAEEVVTDLLDRMGLTAQVTAELGEARENFRYRPIKVSITGDDLSILIGRRAKTLNDFQYITRLIMGKELQHGIPLEIDVEGYRGRREQQVRQLARRVAEQVANTRRRQALEPMPPNERRFAHIELEDNPKVYTESTGENPYRKVVIYPEK
ncbi:MAG: hypothetical protein MAG431_01881 [Chloroflexi bacterium]|nr:hypothetical protein [Chloroflexota bacterium]